jgi:4-coumarate--CoA ligase (photoactive yellow protein activation family)
LNDGGLCDSLLKAPALGGWVWAAATALERSGERLTVRSSGSTGKRRSHVHRMLRLNEEISAWTVLLPDRRRICSAVAANHIYGMLFSLMLPAALELPVVDLRARSPGAVIATLRPGDLVIGHPLFWGSLLRAAPGGWSPGVVGVTSGAAMSDALAADLARAGLARLLDVYGSSETAGIGWRERTADGWRGGGAHRLLPGWRRDAHDLLRRQDDPAPVAPPNRLCWDASGGFKIGERCDGAVVVGGVNVDPARVRAVLCAHPGVADAAVRPMQPAEGARLKAFVVPRPAAAHDLNALRAALAAHLNAVLTAPERPRAFRFGSTLPLTESGKPADWPA